MKKIPKTILEELTNINSNRNSDRFVDMTASNIIESAINLMEYIDNSYDVETSQELKKRLVNSIKTKDIRKFKRGIKKVIESKKEE